MIVQTRKARPTDSDALFDVWQSAVAATHDFVAEDDLEAIARLVRDRYLPTADLDLVVDDMDAPLGFMGMTINEIDSLFVHNDARGQGIGKRLVDEAAGRYDRLRTEVNEQNLQAVGFWTHMGFRVVGRADTDRQGRPYPLLLMERDSGAADAGRKSHE